MKALLLLLCFATPLRSEELAVRTLYLPPWYEKAKLQIYQLEIKTTGESVFIRHPCTVYVTNELVPVRAGVARASLVIDLKKTPNPFPLLICGVEADGKPGPIKAELSCQLSLVPLQYQLQVTGTDFTVTNLTEIPFAIESQGGITVLESTDRLIRGTCSAEGRLQLREKPVIILRPAAQKPAK